MIPALNTRIPNNEFYDPIGMFFWGDDTIEFTEEQDEDGEEWRLHEESTTPNPKI